MPKSLPYHDYLIAKLKNPSYGAVYLETHFELEEGEEPNEALLKLALGDVAEALGQPKMSPEQYELHLKKLEELLSQGGSNTIYNLGNWLKDLGLKLTVAVCTDDIGTDDVTTDVENNTVNAEARSQLTV